MGKKEKLVKKERLAKLKNKMEKDMSLPLRKGATNLVFGAGAPDAEIFFLGEGPGYWEDQKSLPFVGNAGSLLNRLLLLIQLQREGVFITNVVNFRPPENRDPEPEEIAAFKPYIDKMIQIIEPKVIVTLGRFSMAKFLPGVRISDVHGKVYVKDWQGKKTVIIPMYHPAAALRNGAVLEKSKLDFQKIPQVLEKIDELLGDKEEKEKPQKSVKQMQLV